jgi:hypothetical protein
MNIIKHIKPNIRKEQVKRFLTRGHGKSLSRRTRQTLHRSIDDCTRLLKPVVLYKENPIKETSGSSLTLQGDISLQGPRLSGVMRKCTSTTVFLATVGSALDEKISNLMGKKQFAEAYIYDAIGSVAAEETVDIFQRKYDEELGAKRKTSTLRFSPGYCDWPIEEQKKLFKILDSSVIGVKLSPTCLMKPRKSISGIFGIGHSDELGKKSSNPCNRCSYGNCIVRRTD